MTTVKNPQANGILECTHQVIGNLLCSSCLVAEDLGTISAQQELLMPVMWAINTTFHTTLKVNTAQLAFNHDMILPTSFAANWYAINSCKQAQSQSATDAKNHKCIPHEFCLNHQVNWPSQHKVLSRLSMYNNSQSMVPFSYSDHQLL